MTTPDEPPIRSQADLEQAWLHLLRPLGFSSPALWMLLIDGDDRPTPLLVEISELPLSIDADETDKLAAPPPVGPDDVHRLATAVEEALRLEGTEVGSDDVGRTVLEHLRDLDVVAAVRFASVYKEFDDLADFERELTELTQSALTKATEPKRR